MSTRIIAAILAIALGVPTALAEPKAWRVGQAYSLRLTPADLESRDQRAKALAAIENGARKLCRDVTPLRRREACIRDVRDQAIAGGPSWEREAMAEALAERAQLASTRGLDGG